MLATAVAAFRSVITYVVIVVYIALAAPLAILIGVVFRWKAGIYLLGHAGVWLALTLAGSGDATGRRTLGGNLPTAGLAVFDFAVDDWNDVAFRRGKLLLFVSPKLLKQTSADRRH